ncbi:MAG: response regulator [Acidobacteriota bacterium]
MSLQGERAPVLLVDHDREEGRRLEQSLAELVLPDPVVSLPGSKEALDYLAGGLPGYDLLPVLILLDLDLPEKGAFELLTWRRERPEIARIPVLAFTSSWETGHLERAYKLGANAHLLRPLPAEALVETIGALTACTRRPLRLLQIEDDRDDRALVLRALESELPGLVAEQPASPAEFAQALAGNEPDLVLTDFQLGWIDGLAVLRTVKARWSDCPVVMLTGSANEEIVAEALHTGLDDYVLKGATHLRRLPATVRATLARAWQRRTLRQREASFRLLFARNPLPMWVYDLVTLAFLEVNFAAIEHYGYTRAEFMAITIADIRPPEDVPRLIEDVASPRPPRQSGQIWRHRLKNGRIITVEITSHQLELAGRAAALVVAHDITARDQLEADLRSAAVRLQRLARHLADSEEAERRRLAQELHDRVGQSLTALGINLTILRGQLAPPAEKRLAARLDDSQQLVAEIAIVMLTVHEDDAYRETAEAAGATAFVPKRAMATELIPTIARLLGPTPAPGEQP